MKLSRFLEAPESLLSVQCRLYGDVSDVALTRTLSEILALRTNEVGTVTIRSARDCLPKVDITVL